MNRGWDHSARQYLGDESILLALHPFQECLVGHTVVLMSDKAIIVAMSTSREVQCFCTFAILSGNSNHGWIFAPLSHG